MRRRRLEISNTSARDPNAVALRIHPDEWVQRHDRREGILATTTIPRGTTAKQAAQQIATPPS